MVEQTNALSELERQMAEFHLYGQWAVGANRPENVRTGPGNRGFIEPGAKGTPHIWPWEKFRSFLGPAREALTESHTARRTLIMTPPGMQLGTTQGILAAIQTIGPGEIAWAHRHTVTALRFCIEGGPDVYTVVDGEPQPMEPYDLILTPSWCWHDHHNDSDKPAIWLDAVDVPYLVAINQSFYEEGGDAAQEHRTDPNEGSPLLRPAWEVGAGRPIHRYPWPDVRRRLESMKDGPLSPHDGIALEYVNAATGGPTLSTMTCWVQMLPPGFQGARHRHTSSAVYFVVEGEGRTEFEDTDFAWGRHDSLSVPNWTWHRFENTSDRPAILFSVNDSPQLRPFGLYREETDSVDGQPKFATLPKLVDVGRPATQI
jgi:1-hydroxy-2-naphthoate dioxygenase